MVQIFLGREGFDPPKDYSDSIQSVLVTNGRGWVVRPLQLVLFHKILGSRIRLDLKGVKDLPRNILLRLRVSTGVNFFFNVR